jgi:hypothetical protein
MNHLLPSRQARFKVRRLNAAHSAAEWASGATLERCDRSNLSLKGNTVATRFKGHAKLSSLACASATVRFASARRAQVQIEVVPPAASASSATDPLPNPSLERTSTGLALGPRTGQCHHPPRGPSTNPVASAQLKR